MGKEPGNKEAFEKRQKALKLKRAADKALETVAKIQRTKHCLNWFKDAKGLVNNSSSYGQVKSYLKQLIYSLDKSREKLGNLKELYK